MRIGSCFSGIGAMDVAAEVHFGGETVWFCEREPWCQRVLARHWPGVPIYDDVTALAEQDVAPIDVLIGGPPCQDMSSAGKQAGLHGSRSGLFFDFVRVAEALKPQFVVVENVPALLSKWRGEVERTFADAGYGVTWARVAAQHAGAPHKRMRVFVLARLGGRHQGVCDAGPLPPLQAWPTPRTSDTNGPGAHGDGGLDLRTAIQWPTPTLPGGGAMTRSGSRSGERLLNGAVLPQQWPTPRATDNKDGRSKRGNRSAEAVAKAGATLPESVRPQAWPTPAAQEPGIDPSRLVDRHGNPPDSPMQRCYDRDTGRLAQTGLVQAVGWSTPNASDHRDRNAWWTESARKRREKGKQENLTSQMGGRLNPEFVEALQGLPVGYTSADGPSLRQEAELLLAWPQWPAPMVKGLWGDSPQFDHEPPRTVAKGWGGRGERAARLKALGNANPPAQYMLALQTLARGPRQTSLFSLAG